MRLSVIQPVDRWVIQSMCESVVRQSAEAEGSVDSDMPGFCKSLAT